MGFLKLSDLPTVNAALNAFSAVFLLLGYRAIRRGRILLHRGCMLTACASSALFLVCYIYYHLHAGINYFHGQGWIRPAYLTLLTTHTILAIVVLPMVIITLTLALRGRFDRHRRIARWTWPIWVYVSVTGVIVYWLLYHAYAS